MIAASAEVSSRRGTTASILAHTSSTDAKPGARISPVAMSIWSSVASINTRTASASVAEARSTRGRVRSFSLDDGPSPGQGQVVKAFVVPSSA